MSCKVHQQPDRDPLPQSGRRDFLCGAAGGAMLAFPAAAKVTQLGEVIGELYVNGFRAPRGTKIKAGDSVLTGGLLAVFGRGAERTIRIATLTAGICGTGVYVEASSIMSYFCTCSGEVDLECVTYKSRLRVKSDNHKANFIYGKIDSGRSIVSAPVVNHTKAELAELEKMVGRTSPLG